ncbi:MAG: V-type ATPase subunit [Filifactoraceae bacterium]
MSNNFNALNAKIGVLRRGLLSQEDYSKILSFARREELIDYIKNNPIYKEPIAIYREDSIKNRYATEFMIHKAEVMVFNKLKHFLLGEDKKIIDAILTGYEFEDIKIILRSIVEQEKIDIKNDTLMYNINTHVNYEKLAKCENLHQAMEVLKKTPFKRAFIGLVDEDILRLHFHVEMNLNNLYFSFIKNASKALSDENREILDFYFSSRVDTTNLQWIIRAKKYYKLSNEEIYNYSIRYGKYIKGNFLKDLVYAGSHQEVIDKLQTTKFKDLFRNDDKEMETYRNIQKYVYGRTLKKMENYQNSISTLLGFMVQILVQSENIIRIAEAQKYSLSSDETRKYLIQVK